MKQASRILDPCNNNSNASAPVQVEAPGAKFNESWRVNEGRENIPPYRQLNVLLVEDDDSTRHVVAALLRNCGYQVVSASNGLQAWALLMDERGRGIDLVLTDVVMPGLSGVGLLSRIMRRESLKKIPVIMMSSHDSTDVVFKCLSKGAADFLVKPVRKNELKNLWQHSWRRCQSSAGSESETGRLHNACAENELKCVSGSEALEVSDQSDTTQSSCTNKALESPARPRQQQQNTSKRRTPRPNRDSEPAEAMIPQAMDEDLGGASNPPGEQQVNSAVEAADLIGTIPGTANEVAQAESEMGGSNNPETMKDTSSDPASTSKLELSLKSLCPGSEEHEGGNVLRQSGGASAFSRYNTGGTSVLPKQNQNQAQVDHHRQEQISIQDEQHHYHSTITDGGACSSAAAGAGAGEQLCFTPEQHQMMNFAAQHYPVQYAALMAFDHQKMHGATYYYPQPAGVPPWQHAFSPQLHSPKEAELILEQQQRQLQTFNNILAHHHHYHLQNHHHQQATNSNRDPQPGNCGEAPGCGSTNAPDGVSNNNHQFTNGFSGSSHGNNGSMSGSNTGNLNNNCASAHQMNGDSGSGVNNNSPSSVPVGGGEAPVPEQNRGRREAALNKFRLKRKERCFEKKVRYQSRKRLAEQRPRVRGQFVSQAVFDSSVNHT